MFKSLSVPQLLCAFVMMAMVGQTAMAQSSVRAPGLDIPQERWLSYSEEALDEMRTILKKAMQMLADARKSNDAVRLNCVNEKVTSMKGILRVSEDADLALQENMATNAIEKAKKELAKIRIGRTKLKEALTGANTCSGSEASYVGATTVEIEMDPVSKNPASSVEYKATADGNVVAVQRSEAGVSDGSNAGAASGDATEEGEQRESAGGDSTLNQASSTGGIAGSSGTAGSSSSSDDGSGGGTTSSSPGDLNNVNQAGNVSNN
jgi:hypothetical protein